MKTIALAIFLIINVLNGYGQSLEGEWKGYHLEGNFEFSKTEIWISFYKINDTTFEGFSKTIIKNDTSVCILSGGFLKKNILYLEETRVVKEFSGGRDAGCLQIFKLYLREKKKNLTLNGEWVSVQKECGGSGTIRLNKQ